MIAVLRKRNAIIVTLKSTMQVNVESQENYNKLLKWRENQSNESRSWWLFWQSHLISTNTTIYHKQSAMMTCVLLTKVIKMTLNNF